MQRRLARSRPGFVGEHRSRVRRASRSRSASHLEVSADGDEPAPETHPAVRAFRNAGGQGPLCVRSRFPGGRGLGFSAAARVAGPARGPRAARAHRPRGPRRDLAGRDRARGPRRQRRGRDLRRRRRGRRPPRGARSARPRARGRRVGSRGRDRDRQRPAPAPRPGLVRRRGVQRRPHRAARRRARPPARSTRCASRPKTACTRTAASPAPATRTPRSTPCSTRARSRAWLSGSGPSAAAFVDRDDAARIAAALPTDRPHARARHRRRRSDDRCIMKLDGKCVVVTGAAGGIGAALARRFAAEERARIVVADRDRTASRPSRARSARAPVRTRRRRRAT